MELNSFTSFIEIGATITGAFVAVEYTKQYTCLVAQKVFNFLGKIEGAVLECKKMIDEETIEGLCSFNIDGCNTGFKIEGLKRKKEKIVQDINEKKKIAQEYVNNKCNSKSHSSLSLFIFLFSLTSLFVAGVEYCAKMQCFWIFMTSFSFIHIILSWILGEKNRFKYWIDYSSLKSSFYVYFVLLLLSTMATLCIGEAFFYKIISYYNVSVFVTLFLPFVNFIIFALIIKHKSIDINDMIDNTFKPLKDLCIEIQLETKKLSAVNEVALEVKQERKESQSHFNIEASNNVKKRKNPPKRM